MKGLIIKSVISGKNETLKIGIPTVCISLAYAPPSCFSRAPFDCAPAGAKA